MTETSTRWAWLGLALILGAFAVFIAVNFVPAICEPDDNGYFAQGSLLATTGRTWFLPESDIQFIGLHWLLIPSGKYIARYPPGLPLVIATFFTFFGHRGSVLVNPLLALLSLLGTFFLTRRLTNAWWALAATALLAVQPPFTAHALNGDSHITVTALVVWGVVLLLRWHESGRLKDAFFAGLVLGIIPTVRYADSLVALGVAAFFLASLRRFPQIHRHLGAAALGAALPVLLLLVRNQLLLGGFWRTGYSLTNEQTGFSLEYFTEHFVLYLRNLSGDGLRSVFALGLIGCVWMVSEAKDRAVGLLFLVTTTALLLLYMAYYWAGGGISGTMRFILPMFPLYLAATAWLLHRATERAPLVVKITAPLLLFALQLVSARGEIQRVADEQRSKKTLLADLTAELEKVAHDGDIVVSQGELLQHLDFVRKWRVADDSITRSSATTLVGPFPLKKTPPSAPGTVQQLKAELMSKKFGASAEERKARFLAELRTWAAGRRVFVAMAEQSTRFGVLADVSPESLEILTRVPGGRTASPRTGLVGPPPTEEAAAPPAKSNDYLIAEWRL